MANSAIPARNVPATYLPVKEIAVTLGEFQYRIGRERQGPLMAQRSHFVRGIVRKIVKIPQIEIAERKRFGEQPRVQRFLAAEADAQQLRVRELQEAAWRERADGGIQMVEGRFRGG